MKAYDSTEDTLKHIEQVRECIDEIIDDLRDRAMAHDKSKLKEPEKSYFDTYTPLLKNTTYGSDEYKDNLKKMQVGIEHHYKNNSHHPEHYTEGYSQMSLMEIIEMFCDWKAATLRHADGDLHKSILHNQERFGISDDLTSIFLNTQDRLHW